MTFFVQQYTGKKNYQRFLYETHMLYALWHVFWYKKAAGGTTIQAALSINNR